MLGAAATGIDARFDLDDISDAGLWYIWGNSRPLNAPWDYGTMSCCFKSSGNYAQICVYRARDFRIAMREKDTGVWGPWKEFGLTTIS